MIKRNLFLILLSFISCDQLRTNDNTGVILNSTKFNKMNNLKDKWNQLPNIIRDSNQTAKFEMPTLVVDSNGTLLSDDENAEISFDSTNQSIEYTTELSQSNVWVKEYKGREVLFFLGSSMMNMQYNENVIKCYRNDQGKLVDITKEVFPFEEVVKQLYHPKLDDSIISTLDLALSFIIKLNKDNTINVYKNTSFMKQLTDIDFLEDKDDIRLEWSESNGYVIQ